MDYDRAIEKEFESGQCQNYQSAPLESLREHGYREGCWHIYLSRKYGDTVPYTFEAYRRNNSAWDREQYLFALVMGVPPGRPSPAGLCEYRAAIRTTDFRSVQYLVHDFSDGARAATAAELCSQGSYRHSWWFGALLCWRQFVPGCRLGRCRNKRSSEAR